MCAIKIGLLGLGTVGSGVVRVLSDNAKAIEARLGAKIEVKRIAVKNREKERSVEVDRRLITERADEVLGDPEIQMVVELIGGTGEAKEYVLGALASRKHVVTANKTLLAQYGREVFARATENQVDVFYEAAVGGGIPIIRTLREALASERVQAVRAIINGTTNYILSAMTEQRAPFARVLAEAQKLGYAEADPSADVDGHDAAQKLAILASLAFSAHISEKDVDVEGIREISFEDIENARSHGYRIKLLAIAERKGDAVSARVHPAWVEEGSLLAHVNGVLNAVMLESDALGTSMLMGKGAGQLPTGSAVVADIIDVARNIVLGSVGRIPHLATRDEALGPAKMAPLSDLESAYYLRFTVLDSPGVLAGIAGSLGQEGVSLRVVRQEIRGESADAPVSLMVVTHRAQESRVRAAVSRIDSAPTTKWATRLIRIVDSIA
jgi:homoserine dehydrogenase